MPEARGVKPAEVATSMADGVDVVVIVDVSVSVSVLVEVDCRVEVSGGGLMHASNLLLVTYSNSRRVSLRHGGCRCCVHCKSCLKPGVSILAFLKSEASRLYRCCCGRCGGNRGWRDCGRWRHRCFRAKGDGDC